jgi:hypothetical protein
MSFIGISSEDGWVQGCRREVRHSGMSTLDLGISLAPAGTHLKPQTHETGGELDAELHYLPPPGLAHRLGRASLCCPACNDVQTLRDHKTDKPTAHGDEEMNMEGQGLAKVTLQVNSGIRASPEPKQDSWIGSLPQNPRWILPPLPSLLQPLPERLPVPG